MFLCLVCHQVISPTGNWNLFQTVAGRPFLDALLVVFFCLIFRQLRCCQNDDHATRAVDCLSLSATRRIAPSTARPPNALNRTASWRVPCDLDPSCCNIRKLSTHLYWESGRIFFASSSPSSFLLSETGSFSGLFWGTCSGCGFWPSAGGYRSALPFS